MTKKTSIVWFRQDLRLSDNSAFSEGLNLGKIFPIYILDNCAPNLFKLGEASKIWLHHSFNNLNAALNSKLNIYTRSVLNLGLHANSKSAFIKFAISSDVRM